jgi:hypothetical protein
MAAAGAVVLGELGQAASLAFLFSISEALEDYALDSHETGTARPPGPRPRGRYGAPQ